MVGWNTAGRLSCTAASCFALSYSACSPEGLPVPLFIFAFVCSFYKFTAAVDCAQFTAAVDQQKWWSSCVYQNFCSLCSNISKTVFNTPPTYTSNFMEPSRIRVFYLNNGETYILTWMYSPPRQIPAAPILHTLLGRSLDSFPLLVSFFQSSKKEKAVLLTRVSPCSGCAMDSTILHMVLLNQFVCLSGLYVTGSGQLM